MRRPERDQGLRPHRVQVDVRRPLLGDIRLQNRWPRPSTAGRTPRSRCSRRDRCTTSSRRRRSIPSDRRRRSRHDMSSRAGPSFFILPARVVGFGPSNSAAPPGLFTLARPAAGRRGPRPASASAHPQRGRPSGTPGRFQGPGRPASPSPARSRFPVTGRSPAPSARPTEPVEPRRRHPTDGLAHPHPEPLDEVLDQGTSALRSRSSRTRKKKSLSLPASWIDPLVYASYLARLMPILRDGNMIMG